MTEIALLSDDLMKLPHLLRLSRQAMRVIRQNLFFSLSVLAIAVGLAIPGILAPVTGCNGYLDHPFKNMLLETEKDLLPRLANTAGLMYNQSSSASTCSNDTMLT